MRTTVAVCVLGLALVAGCKKKSADKSAMPPPPGGQGSQIVPGSAGPSGTASGSGPGAPLAGGGGAPAPSGEEGAADPEVEAPAEGAQPMSPCGAACAKREACVHKDDQAECEAACTAVGFTADYLEQWSGRDCAALQADDGDHLLLRQAVRTCQHIIECGEPGDFATCLALVAQNLKLQNYGSDKLVSWEAMDCPELTAAVTLEAPAAAPSGGGGGGAGGGSCRSIRCSEGAAGDRLCHSRGCGGGCFWGGCNSF